MDRAIVRHIIRMVPSLLLFLLLGLPLVLLLLQWLSGEDKSALLSSISRETLVLVGKSLLISGIVALLATFTGTVCGFILYKIVKKGPVEKVFILRHINFYVVFVFFLFITNILNDKIMVTMRIICRNLFHVRLAIKELCGLN